MDDLVRRGRQISVVAILLGIVGATSAGATPIVTTTVTPVGATFHYEYAITFDQDELFFVTINVLPDDSTLTNLVVLVPDPSTGEVSALYNTVGLQGFVDVFPNLNFNFPGMLLRFAFDSAHSPGATTFDALTISGTVSDVTTGPLGPVVPEPASWGLLAIGLGALAGRRTFRKRIQSGG